MAARAAFAGDGEAMFPKALRGSSPAARWVVASSTMGTKSPHAKTRLFSGEKKARHQICLLFSVTMDAQFHSFLTNTNIGTYQDANAEKRLVFFPGVPICFLVPDRKRKQTEVREGQVSPAVANHKMFPKKAKSRTRVVFEGLGRG